MESIVGRIGLVIMFAVLSLVRDRGRVTKFVIAASLLLVVVAAIGFLNMRAILDLHHAHKVRNAAKAESETLEQAHLKTVEAMEREGYYTWFCEFDWVVDGIRE